MAGGRPVKVVPSRFADAASAAGDRPLVTALIPAYNEAETIGATVEALARLPDVAGSGEIIVVDDGSRDGTARRARAAGARVVGGVRRRGKAAAVRLGISRAAGHIIVLVDADTGSTASAAGVLLQAVTSGAADLAIGIVPPEHADVYGSAARRGFGAAVGLARWGIYRLAGRRMIQPLSGQRVFFRRLTDDITYWGRGFGLETALTVHALRKGWRVMEVPAPFRHRVTEMDLRGLLHRGRQTVHVAATLAALAAGGGRSGDGASSPAPGAAGR